MRHVLTLVVVGLLFAGTAHAQTTTNPKSIAFTASADHAKTLPDGTAAVTGYQFDTVIGNPLGALALTKSLGKPTPDATNTITVGITEFGGLPFGQYVGFVSAVGPGGTAKSAPSDPFNAVPAPGAPGKPVAK